MEKFNSALKNTVEWVKSNPKSAILVAAAVVLLAFSL